MCESKRSLHWSNERRMLMLKVTAYLDESQVTTDTKHVVVAGFYGENASWDSFSGEWQAELARRGRKHLHMKELRWSSKKAEKRIKPLLSDLGSLPAKYRLSLLYGAVRVSDYSDMLVGNSPAQKILNGYLVCFSKVLADLCIVLPAHASLRVVCEQQKVYEALARKMFELVARSMSRNPRNAWLDGFTSVPKASIFMTELADYLAFAIGKFLDEEGTKKDLWCRPIFGGVEPKRLIKVRSRDAVSAGTRIVLESSKRGESVFESTEFEEWWKAQGKNQANVRALTERLRN